MRSIRELKIGAAWLDTWLFAGDAKKIAQGPASRTRNDIRFMDVGGAQIRYRIAGEGKRTIVLTPDPPAVLELYDRLIQELSRDFRVVIFEAPGFGFSTPARGFHFGLDEMVSVLKRFLEGLTAEPSVLAFPCVSAYAALKLASQHPDLVAGVILIQAPSWEEEVRWKHGRDPKGVLDTPVLGQIALRLLRNHRVKGWYEAALGNLGCLENFLSITRQAFAMGASFSLASAFQEYLTERAPGFPKISQPALIVWGEADRSHRHTDKRSLLDVVPHADVAFVEGAGHFPELENPRRFSELAIQFSREKMGSAACAGLVDRPEIDK